MSNFTFLEKNWSDLAELGDFSEKYLYSDPVSSITKQGMLAENMVRYIMAYENIPEPLDRAESNQANNIRILRDNDIINYDISKILHMLRKARNLAVHESKGTVDIARDNLESLYDLCVWYMQVYGDWNFEPEPFVEPVNFVVDVNEFEKVKAELEAKNDKLIIELQKIRSEAAKGMVKRAVEYKKIFNAKLTEAQTRKIIDEKLRAVGWEVDTENLTYAKGAKPEKGKNRAISEWPTNSTTGKRGYADYALFVGEKLVGIVEAKRAHKNVSSVIDGQCKAYAKMIREEDQKYVVKKYGEYYVPFLFATNGREYVKQFETQSGIWFLDARESFNVPRALLGWKSPDNLMQELEKDIAEADKTLATTGYELLENKDGLGLRYYQIEAIKAAEKAIADGQSSVLLAMATGTGKTRTVLGMIYRFLTSKRFKRILYLVDRTALGNQTMDTFKEVKLEDLKTLNQIYDIKDLGEKTIEKDTRVHIATVQSLVKRVLLCDEETSIGVSDYDLIIVDEAHRGYVLDKDMTEAETLFRNQDDFRSKYRAVIDYFDAVKIALTATPALHTTEIFGAPVYKYNYRTAVIDGFLCDHDAPHIIKTKLSEEGISFAAGSIVPIWDPIKHEIANKAELEDDIKFEISDFNKKVINKSFNEVVLSEIALALNPWGKGKTLIFAVNDDHANMIVDILKNYYAEYGLSNDAVMKITGSIENGNSEKIGEAIRRFKNEQYPNIVVTVDLLTTGIDVEEIVNLVFMRRIHSRILYEQMLGRATRLCPEIGKTHFEIYDAVRLYEAMQEVTDMKPVVTNAHTTLEKLIDGLDLLETEEQKQNQMDMIIAKINRIKNRITKEDKDEFVVLSECNSFDDYLTLLKKLPLDKAIDSVKKNKDGLVSLSVKHPDGPILADKIVDEVISNEQRFYDLGPEDYLKEFHEFITTHKNEIKALTILATKPQNLTRKELKELRIILAQNKFTEVNLQNAWKQYKNQDIAADIISFIRQKSLGDTLVSRYERVHQAVAKLKAAHPELKPMQITLLDKIEDQLLQEPILNHETFETVAFMIDGGFKVCDKRLEGKLDSYIDEINEYMYA